MKSKKQIENKIYASIIGVCEEREKKGAYRGNGHHLAQELTVRVTEALLAKQQRKIYDAMSKTPMTSGQIAIATKLSSRIVSAQLKAMYNNTFLISSKNRGRIKIWSRYHVNN